MNKKLALLVSLFAILCVLPTSLVYAMGSAPPPPTQEVGVVPTASEEALAKQQVDNLKNISVNSQSVREGYEKFVKDVTNGKKYLYEFNDIAKKQFIKDVLDKRQDWKYRFAIISALNPDDPPEAFDANVKIFEDKSEKTELRRGAIEVIPSTKRGDKKTEALEVLIRALKDDDWNIVGSAANGLGELKSKEAVRPLIDSVRRTQKNIDKLLQEGWEEYKKGSQPEDLALACSIKALGNIGSAIAIPVLVDVLRDPYLEKTSEKTPILNLITKGFAIKALKAINDEHAIESIKELLSTTQDSFIIETANDALRSLTK